MSRKPQPPHRTKVGKYNLRGFGRMWWTTCSCGFFNGWTEKAQAQNCALRHEMSEKEKWLGR